jgi:hypothetical protein
LLLKLLGLNLLEEKGMEHILNGPGVHGLLPLRQYPLNSLESEKEVPSSKELRKGKKDKKKKKIEEK